MVPDALGVLSGERVREGGRHRFTRSWCSSFLGALMGVAFFLKRRPRLSYGGGVGVDWVEVLVLVLAEGVGLSSSDIT